MSEYPKMLYREAVGLRGYETCVVDTGADEGERVEAGWKLRLDEIDETPATMAVGASLVADAPDVFSQLADARAESERASDLVATMQGHRQALEEGLSALGCKTDPDAAPEENALAIVATCIERIADLEKQVGELQALVDEATSAPAQKTTKK